MLLVAVDDTDSPEGGCTTALAAPLASLFFDLPLDGPARLVRLNPNVPWKTRGNAAIALRFAGDVPLDRALDRVVRLVEKEARAHAGTEPGVVVASAPLPARLYDDVVSRVVERDEVEAVLAAAGARWWGGRGVTAASEAREDQAAPPWGRGVIGAAAALAWPAERATWERIAYRAPERVGTPRDVADAWVREVEWGYAAAFDSYDLANDEVVCVPNGPDPVLWGIRSDDPRELERASAILGPERPVRETLFLTNQGTDDHLRDRRAGECREYESARLRGRVAERPVERHGTVLVTVRDETGALRCAAYPPTRDFRHVVRALDAGDEVTVCGGIHRSSDGALTLGIEKMFVHATTPRRAGAPSCPNCGRTMESAGKEAGFRCRDCHTRADAARTADSRVRPGWHEVPASARRHLAMPLKRAMPTATPRWR